MKITVNSSQREIPDGTSIESLVTAETGSTAGTAVAVNDAIVRRGEWPTATLHEGDSVVIIKAAYGG